MKINIHTSHPSAFISSTFADLKEERDAIADVLRGSNLNINALDIKPASNDSSRKEILSGIRESDFIILIIGERYGSIIPKMTQSKKLSITRWEYIRAVRYMKKNALVYFKRVNSNHPVYYDDIQSPDYKMKRIYLDEFKKELSNTHNPKYFTTADELAEEVKRAIIPTYRSGVRSLLAKNEKLQKEIAELKSKYEAIVHSNIYSNPKGVVGSQSPTGLRGLLDAGIKNTETRTDVKTSGLLGVGGIIKSEMDKNKT